MSSSALKQAPEFFRPERGHVTRPNGYRALRRGTGGGKIFGCPTIIGATGTQAEGNPSMFLPSDVLRKLCANPIQQVPYPRAYAASIRFSAASAQSSTIHGPLSAPRNQNEHWRMIKDMKAWIGKPRSKLFRLSAWRHICDHVSFGVSRYSVERRLVADHREHPGLLVYGVGRENRRVDEVKNCLSVDGVLSVLAYRSSAV